MDIKKILTILTIMSLIFLFGCGEEKVTTREATPFIGGANGLSMSFISGLPPDYIFDNSQFPFGIGVQIKNVGEDAVDTDEAYVEIVGINPKDFGLGSQADLKEFIPDDLTAARKNFDGTILQGGQTAVTFDELKYVPDIKGNTMATIRANLCYNYKTETSTKICIKPKLLETVEDETICVVNEEKDAQNSGGPVHITSFKEAPIGQNKIQLNFVVSHVGEANGKIFKLTAPDCKDEIGNVDRNKVFVRVTSDVDARKASCQGLEEASQDNSAGYITLYDGAPRTVTCTLDTTGIESTFEDLFTVDLEYKYMQYIEKQIDIRDVTTSS